MDDFGKQLERITKIEADHQPLTLRMEEDFKLFKLTPFQIPKKEGTWDSFTTNRASVLGHAAVDILAGSDLRLKIPQGNANDPQRDLISATEQLVLGCLKINDETLMAIPDSAPLKAEMSFHAPIRGWLGVRVWLYEEDGRVIPSIVCWDIFSTYWMSDAKGVNWVCYKRYADPAEIKDSYGKIIEPNEARGVPIYNVVDKGSEGVFHKGEGWLQTPEKHGHDHIPVLILPMGSTPRVNSDQSVYTIAQQGESIYKNDRLQFDQVSRLGSYAITLAGRVAKAPQTAYFDSNSGSQHPEFESDPNAKGAFIWLDKGKGQELGQFAQPQMSRDAYVMYEKAEAEISIGGMDAVIHGVVQGDPAGVSIAQRQKGALKIINPYREGMERAYAWIANEIVYQFKNEFDADMSITVSGRDREGNEFESELTPDVITTKRFRAELVPNLIQDEQMNISMAVTATQANANGEQLLSMETARDVFHLAEDTNLEQDKIDRRKLLGITQLNMRRYAKLLEDDGDFEGARMVLQALQETQAPQGPGGTVQPGMNIPAPPTARQATQAESPGRLQKAVEGIRNMVRR